MNGPYDRDATLLGLTRALPYIRLYRGRTFVLKLGGAASSEPDVVRRVLGQVSILSELGIRIVIVHGGGPQTTALAARLGLATEFVDGRRITPPEALAAAVMAIAGDVNTTILAACRAAHITAVGLSGVDAGLVRATKRPPVLRGERLVDYGEVGDVTAIDPGVLETLLAAGCLPVVASLAASDDGRVLNVNADTVASRIAIALGAEKLIFLTDTPGLLGDREDPGSLISYVDLAGLDRLEAKGALAGGMLPKVQAVRAALAGSVARVHIVGAGGAASLLAEVFTNEGAGTLVVRDAADLSPAEHALGPVRVEEAT